MIDRRKKLLAFVWRGGPRLAVLLLAASGATSVGGASAPQRITSTLSYTATASGVPTVEVTLEGKGPVRFMVDTGAAVSLVTEHVVERDRLKKVDVKEADVARLRLPWSGKPQLVQVGAFGIGGERGALFSNIPLLVLPKTKCEFLMAQGIDGIIGVNFLSQLAVLLDPAGREIRLMYPGKLQREEAEALGFNGAPVSLIEERGGTYAVQARLNDILDVKPTLDTGGQASQISRAAAKRLRLDPVGRVNLGTLVANVPHSRSLVDITVGEIRAKAVPVLFPDKDRGERVGTGPALGMDFLSRVTILIDFPGEVVYLKPTISLKGRTYP